MKFGAAGFAARFARPRFARPRFAARFARQSPWRERARPWRRRGTPPFASAAGSSALARARAADPRKPDPKKLAPNKPAPNKPAPNKPDPKKPGPSRGFAPRRRRKRSPKGGPRSGRQPLAAARAPRRDHLAAPHRRHPRPKPMPPLANKLARLICPLQTNISPQGMGGRGQALMHKNCAKNRLRAPKSVAAASQNQTETFAPYKGPWRPKSISARGRAHRFERLFRFMRGPWLASRD